MKGFLTVTRGRCLCLSVCVSLYVSTSRPLPETREMYGSAYSAGIHVRHTCLSKLSLYLKQNYISFFYKQISDFFLFSIYHIYLSSTHKSETTILSIFFFIGPILVAVIWRSFIGMCSFWTLIHFIQKKTIESWLWISLFTLFTSISIRASIYFRQRDKWFHNIPNY